MRENSNLFLIDKIRNKNMLKDFFIDFEFDDDIDNDLILVRIF